MIHCSHLNNVTHGNKKTSSLVVVAVRCDGDGSAAKFKRIMLSHSTLGSWVRISLRIRGFLHYMYRIEIIKHRG